MTVQVRTCDGLLAPYKLVEGSQDPEVYCFFSPEFVVAAADVLDERVPGANHWAERSRLSPRVGLGLDLGRT
jgi:hypothetical protein